MFINAFINSVLFPNILFLQTGVFVPNSGGIAMNGYQNVWSPFSTHNKLGFNRLVHIHCLQSFGLHLLLKLLSGVVFNISM